MDLADIDALTHRYADAVCRRDTPAWLATWAPDAVWEIGRGPVVGREAIGAAFGTAMSLFADVVQTALNGTAEVDGERGEGRRYMMEHSVTLSGRRLLYLGYYDDRYVRIDGRWHFASRTLRWLYQGPPNLSGTFGPPPGYR
jgi:hypothetical protein